MGAYRHLGCLRHSARCLCISLVRSLAISLRGKCASIALARLADTQLVGV